MTTRTSVALALVLLAGAGQAQAVPLSSTEMLQQFNVVVSGNLTSNSHVDGRAYVGGNVSGGGYAQHASRTPGSAYAGLTVGGNVSGNAHVNGLGAVVGGNISGSIVNSGESYVGGRADNSSFNGGHAWVGGQASNVKFGHTLHAAGYSGVNLNGKELRAPTATMNSTLAASTSTDFGSLMTGLSAQLAALTPTPGALVEFGNNGRQVTFTGTAVDGLLVFDLTTLDSRIFSATDPVSVLVFKLTGASTVIFNTNDSILNLSANFNQAQSLGSSLIWNFAGASSVTVNRTFGGQVLVADGTFRNNNANVEGGVFAKELFQHGEIHLQPFKGALPLPPALSDPITVPEPGTLALLAAGAGLIGFTRRRKRAQA